MAYSHVAHNCTVGNHVIMANSANLAGHVTVEDYVTVGGVTAVHQFARIGCHSFIGGGSRIPQDVAPYTLVAGNPVRLAGLNLIGLKRRGFAPDALEALELAFRIVFRSRLLVGDALAMARRAGPAAAGGRPVPRVRRGEPPRHHAVTSGPAPQMPGHAAPERASSNPPASNPPASNSPASPQVRPGGDASPGSPGKNPLRIGVAGTGYLGARHARKLAARPDVAQLVLYDRDPMRAAALAEELGPARAPFPGSVRSWRRAMPWSWRPPPRPTRN